MSELRTNRIVPRDGLPSGSSGGIIQIKQTVVTSTKSTTSTSFENISGLAVSITPTRADSKIMLMAQLSLSQENWVKRIHLLITGFDFGRLRFRLQLYVESKGKKKKSSDLVQLS